MESEASVAILIDEVTNNRKRIINLRAFKSQTQCFSNISVNYRDVYLLEKTNKKLEDVPHFIQVAECSNHHQPSVSSSLVLSTKPSLSSSPVVSDIDILRTAQKQLFQYRQHNVDMDTFFPPKSLLLVKVLQYYTLFFLLILFIFYMSLNADGFRSSH